jgi:hypothetical protein
MNKYISTFIFVMVVFVIVYAMLMVGFHIGRYNILYNCDHAQEFRVGESYFICERVKK